MFRKIKSILLGAVLAAVPAFAADVAPQTETSVCNKAQTSCTGVTSSRLDTDASQSGTWTTGRTWTLLNSTDSVNSVQSGTWTTGRTWTLSNGSDSIAAVQSGNWSTRTQDGSGNLITSQASGSQRALDIGIDVAGVQVDPRAIRTLTSSDTVTSVQGTAATASGAWPFKLTDGTNITAVKAASTSPAATDPAAVVALSPNGNQATAANQATEITNLGNINTSVQNPQGSVSPGTAATKSDLAGGIYNSAGITLTNGQQSALQLDSAGNLYTHQAFVATINRQDVSTTVTASGNSSGFDSSGLAQLSIIATISSITGTTPTIIFHLQGSDDNSNWTTYDDAAQMSTATSQAIIGLRLPTRYYRYSWTVAGSSPSITFTIQTTIKQTQTTPHFVRYFYSDPDLGTNGNQGTTFIAEDCKNISIMAVRGAGGNNAVVQIFGSNDNVSGHFVSVSGNLNVNPSTVNNITLSNLAFRYYAIQVTTHATVGNVADFHWSCN